jgi:hypothetical protein
LAFNGSCRHPDFEKIHSAFLSHYSQDLKLGESRYEDWVAFSGLDQTQSYYLQGAARAAGTKQSFNWANFLLQFVKEDKDALYYKVEALFPVESMNKDSPPFTRDEVLQAARSLTGKPSDLNHDFSKTLAGVEVVAAQFEDDCVECLVRVPKTSILVGMIDRKEIVNVSIEGEWSHGVPGQGLVLTGLGWLTKDTMLPGIPLTRIMPVEKIAESFRGVEILEEKQILEIAEKVAAKIGEKTPENEKLKTDLTEAQKKVSEAEGKLKLSEAALLEANAKLGPVETKLSATEQLLNARNVVIEKFKKCMPDVELVANPPVMMPVEEHLASLQRVLPPAVVENSSMSMKRQGQAVRAEIFKAEERLKVK